MDNRTDEKWNHVFTKPGWTEMRLPILGSFREVTVCTRAVEPWPDSPQRDTGFLLQANESRASGIYTKMSTSDKLCPFCGAAMIDTIDKIEPYADTEVTVANPEDVESGVALKRLECPRCKHAEGQHPKGSGTWKNTKGESTM